MEIKFVRQLLNTEPVQLANGGGETGQAGNLNLIDVSGTIEDQQG